MLFHNFLVFMYEMFKNKTILPSIPPFIVPVKVGFLLHHCSSQGLVMNLVLLARKALDEWMGSPGPDSQGSVFQGLTKLSSFLLFSNTISVHHKAEAVFKLWWPISLQLWNLRPNSATRGISGQFCTLGRVACGVGAIYYGWSGSGGRMSPPFCHQYMCQTNHLNTGFWWQKNKMTSLPTAANL